MVSKKPTTEQRIHRKQLDTAILVALEEVYGKHLKENTFSGTLNPEKASIVSKWDIKQLAPFEYLFSNPNYFDIHRQEFGITPQIISAKNKKMLKFKTPQGRKSAYEHIPGNIAFEKDGYVYAKMVRHPGFEGRHFIQKMLLDKSLMERFGKELNSNMKKLIAQGIEETLKD